MNEERKEMTDRELIEQACASRMLTIKSWDEENEDGLTANLGRWKVYHDEYAERGFYVDDVGTLSACVVGAVQYHNQRVCFSFTPQGMDGGEEVPEGDPLSVLDPV